MKTLRQTLERNLYGIAAAAFLLAATVPNILISSISAAPITARSIQMEVATPGAEDVEYTITFTPGTTGSIQAIVVDFCNEASSPLIGTACTAPTDFSAEFADVESTSMSGTWVASTLNSHRTLVLTNGSGSAVVDDTPVEVVVSGFDNPSTLGTFYARIITYSDDDHVATHNPENINNEGTHVDSGSVALSTTENIEISAAVLETLTFCVSASAPTAGCGGTDEPSLVLGQGTPPALSTLELDFEDAYFQLSTNAVNTTAVNIAGDTLKNGEEEIEAAGDDALVFEAGDEFFGLRIHAVAGVGTNPFGTVTPQAPYDGGDPDAYGFHEDVSSTYGHTIAQATGPVGDMNAQLRFGASIDNSTAAGLYTTSLNLIATSAY